jgi:tetratricopeptide (TPR) repeat protein
MFQRLRDPYEDLLGRPQRARVHFCRNRQSLWQPEVVRRLLERAYELRFTDSCEMTHLAELAVECAARCDLPAVPSADLQAEAWSHLANAHKVRGSFRLAERAFKLAERFERSGSGAPRIVACRLEWLASLRTRQARPAEAVDHLDAALQHRIALGEPHAVATTLIHLAIATTESGRPEEGLFLVIRAMKLIDLETDLRLGLIARHYGVVCLWELGRLDSALRFWKFLEPLYRILGDPLLLLRCRWLEAQILAGYRDPLRDFEAERTFRATVEEALGLGLPYEATEILLDLGVFYAERQRFALLPALLEEILPIFDDLGIGRESLTVRLLQRAVKRHSQTAKLLRQAKQRIERLNPA